MVHKLTIVNKFTELCNHHHSLIVEMSITLAVSIHLQWMESSIHMSSLRQQLIYFFVLSDFSFLDIWYECDCAICDLMCPAAHIAWCFSASTDRFNMFQDFTLLTANSIPLYRYITFCISIPQSMDLWVVSTF